MKRPSAQALDLADEILDHVRHGLTRADALHELADLIDDNNAELLRAIRRLLGDAAYRGGIPDRDTVADLEAVARDYQPLRPADDVQADLFALQGASPRLF